MTDGYWSIGIGQGVLFGYINLGIREAVTIRGRELIIWNQQAVYNAASILGNDWKIFSEDLCSMNVLVCESIQGMGSTVMSARTREIITRGIRGAVSQTLSQRK